VIAAEGHQLPLDLHPVGDEPASRAPVQRCLLVEEDRVPGACSVDHGGGGHDHVSDARAHRGGERVERADDLQLVRERRPPRSPLEEGQVVQDVHRRGGQRCLQLGLDVPAGQVHPVVDQSRAAHRPGTEGQELLDAGLGQEPRKQQGSELARRAGDGHPQRRAVLSAHPGAGV
jgi:hypothetical protein